MTPKEQADELISSMLSYVRVDKSFMLMKISAKFCAIEAVKQILIVLKSPPIENKGHMLYDSQIDYWNQVEAELRTQ
jgi:hypothetical protein